LKRCLYVISILLFASILTAAPEDASAENPASCPSAPVVIGPLPFNGKMLVVPGGDFVMFRVTGGNDESLLESLRSPDCGLSWPDSSALRELPGTGWAGVQPVLDRDGEVHLFIPRWRNREGETPAVDRFIDIWHMRSRKTWTEWSEPQRIFEGYVGSIQNAVQLESGRIVLPFARWVGGRLSAPPTGSNVTTTVFSDDGGESWTLSGAALTAPCYANYNGNNYGAVEPVILQLSDGRVWMLVRTQTGFLYESFSPDGEHWSELMPTRFHSSTSPAFLVRTGDGSTALFWNNCQMPPRVDGAGVYGGRDAIHAAVSGDEGKTWSGFREVYRDPARNETPPKRGDRGTAYPYAVLMQDGRIALLTGQGGGRRGLIHIDPLWLKRTTAEDRFETGLERWSVFKAFGPASGWWRDRVPGARLVEHPDKPGAKLLHVRRPDEKPADGAVWNFPTGRRGRLMLRLMIPEGSGGASIALGDRFFNPTGDDGERFALFRLSIAGDGSLPGGYSVPEEEFFELTLEWDADRRHCRVLIDGVERCGLPLLTETVTGACYLRLRSTAVSRDSVGFLVESVKADVSASVSP